jgi:copper chaperone CopZ
MNTEIIQIENLKCGGCAAAIKNGIEKLDVGNEVQVDLEGATVTVNNAGNLDRNTLIKTLTKMGYPESGTGTTMQKMKSYVSCAVGRMGK